MLDYHLRVGVVGVCMITAFYGDPRILVNLLVNLIRLSRLER